MDINNQSTAKGGSYDVSQWARSEHIDLIYDWSQKYGTNKEIL